MRTRKFQAAAWIIFISMAYVSFVAGTETAGNAAESSVAISLSGSDWRIHEDAEGQGEERGMTTADASAAGWIPAAVPGNVQADLEAAHLLKPLWYGAGDPRLYNVAQKDWWYRKNFHVPAEFKGKRLTLVFDGVDHECAVWLNAKRLGANAGMFRRFQFDVSEIVEPGQINRLAVRIARIPETLAPLVVRTDGQGVVNNETHFLRGLQLMPKILKELKSATNWAYDWGVNIWTLGIWKDVRLEATGPARIDWTRVQTALSEDHAKAEITTTLEIDSLANIPAKARFQIAGQGQTADATVEAELKKGRNVVQAKLTLDRPALWWPAGHGDQPLYMLRAELRPADGGPAMDVRDARFGVRDVRWVHTEGTPADFISRYQLILNGRPIRTIGSNLIPPDLLFGRMGPRALNLLRHAKASGMNTLRIWGGGVILHDDFYDLADELGIMLLLELPMANHMPETDPIFLANLEKTARNIVRQVRNHPSIIELDGGNEMPWKSTTKHPGLQMLQKIAAEDDGRLFRATCPDLGATHSPWTFDLRRTCRSYDERKTMRAGEFGTSSPANIEVWHREIPPASQWPIVGVQEPVLIRKNIVQAVFSPANWLCKHAVDDVFGPSDDLPALVEAGQFYGAEGLRYAIDALRRKGKAIGGMTTWDYNEPWPNGAGSYLVDYDGRTLLSYDFFKQAVAPVSLSLKYDSIFFSPRSGMKAELFLTSDAPQDAENLRWKWLARDRRGTVFARNEGVASIEPIEVKSLGQVELKPPAQTAFGPLFIELRLEDSQGKLLTERVHVFGSSGAGSLAGLLQTGGHDSDDNVAELTADRTKAVWRPVRRTSLEVKALPVRVEDGQEVLDLIVKNTGPMTALFCEPHPLVEYRTDLFIDNNHCFIPPGESRTITICANREAADGLSLAQTGWRISCWNADDATVEPSGDVLLAVGRRDKMCREYLGYFDASEIKDVKQTSLEGRSPDTAQLPYLLDSDRVARFKFSVSAAQAKRPARLRIHAADQSKDVAVAAAMTINGQAFEKMLPKGIALQKENPAHLAFPATATFEIPADLLREGENVVEVRVSNGGWFTWDAMELIALSHNPDKSATAKPNIVYILTDDMGYADAGFMGSKEVFTPQLDKLAGDGTILTSFYAQPVCSPTRAALMTGRYPSHTGVYHVVRPKTPWGLKLEERTLAQALREAGYETAMVGKWHLGEFDPAYLPTRRGFDRQYGHWFGALDYFTHMRNGVLDWHRNDELCEDEGYTTHLLAKEACRIIRECRTEKPLFLYLAFNAVHDPFQVPDDYLEPFDNLKGDRRLYAGMIAAMDEAVGQVVAALKEQNMFENTLIVFSSDNGGPSPGRVTSNRPLRAGKNTLYEGGVRACAFASWPGRIPAGKSVDEPLHIVDWYPTLVKLAGGSLEQKLPIDGFDVWPVLTEGAKSPHDAVLLCGGRPKITALRMGDWKLVPGKHGDELYNLAADIGETADLAKSQPEIMEEIKSKRDALMRDAVPPGWLNES